MRILFISNLYPPHFVGGLELRCQETLDCLRARGHICHVLTSRCEQDHSLSEEGITRELYLQANVYHYRPFDFFLRRPWQEHANRRALRRLLDDFQPDAVFIWGMWNLSPTVAYWAEQWMPGRVAYNIGAYWPMETDLHVAYWSTPARNPATRILLWPFARLAQAIMKAEKYPPRLQFRHVSCCSQYVVNVLTDAGAIPPGAVAILNGIDPNPFINNERQPHEYDNTLQLVYFGGLMEHKGVHTAIEALGLLQKNGVADHLYLTIVGDGHPNYRARLQALVQSLSLEEKVRFLGQVSRSQIPNLLSDFDVFLFTSIYAEPFGRTIVEAMAAGLAVIGSDVGGSREIFEYYPEYMLFPPGDAKALARVIERLADDSRLMRQLGQIGQALVLEHFTLERMVNEIEDWLKGIVV